MNYRQRDTANLDNHMTFALLFNRKKKSNNLKNSNTFN